MRSIEVHLFRNNYEPFCNDLRNAGIEFVPRPLQLGKIYAAGLSVDILCATAAVLAPVAAVLVAWIQSRQSRNVIITMNDNKIVHISQGMNADEIEELLKKARWLDVIDTRKDHDKDGDHL
jgi:hypothetical protein